MGLRLGRQITLNLKGDLLLNNLLDPRRFEFSALPFAGTTTADVHRSAVVRLIWMF